MANEERSSSRDRDNPVKKKRKPSKKVPTYFFLDGSLLKRLHVDRGADLVTCWEYYPEGKIVAHSWSETRRKMKPAFRNSQVVVLLNRTRISIENAILRGDIRPPAKLYSLEPDRKPGRYMWSEANVMEARDYFSTVHYGRPRKDGRITSKPIPTRAELRAMMEQGTVTYVKTSDGEFIPMFKEIVW